MEIKEIPIPTMPDWLKLYNTYDPEYYAPGKRVSAEEWNTLFLASVRQGNYNADTLELLIKTYLPETYLTQVDFNQFSNEMRMSYSTFTNNIQKDFTDHKAQVQEQYDTFTTQVQEDFTALTSEVNSLEERVVKAEDVAYSLNDVIQEANEYAQAANQTAIESNTFAQEARDTASTALETANNAASVAASSNTTAQDALSAAQSAVTTANNAATHATQAVNTANAASLRAEDAIATANAAKAESAAAKNTAAQAETTANASNTTAESANDTASEAKRIAQNALDLITEGQGSQVLVGGVAVAIFDADTKADLDYVDRQIAALVGAAPETLDTLEELATAFEENADVVKTLEAAIVTKVAKTDIEDFLSATSTNPVQNKVLYNPVTFAESERQKGKNLLNIPDVASYTTNGVTLTIKDNIITLNGTTTAFTTFYRPHDLITANVGKYAFSFKYISGTISGNSGAYSLYNQVGKNEIYYPNTSVINNITEVTDYNQLRIAISNGITFDNFKYSLQYEEGSVATDYQAYNGAIAHKNDIPTTLDYYTTFSTDSLNSESSFIFKDSVTGLYKRSNFQNFMDSFIKSNYLPLTGSNMTGAITFSNFAYSNTEIPTALSYGRLQSYGTLKINGNTDNSGTEYVLITSGHGCSDSVNDGLAIGADTLTWKGNSIALKSELPEGDVYTTLTVIDATSLDENTYYPVTFDAARKRLKVMIYNQWNGGNPTWSTHNSQNYSTVKIWEASGCGWGENTIDRVIYNSTYNWVSEDPVRGIGQLGNSSTEYVYVRGGGKYNVYTSHNVVPELKTEDYTVLNQTLSPTTTAPAEIVSTVATTNDLQSYVTISTAQTITGAKTFTSDITLTKAAPLINVTNTGTGSATSIRFTRSDTGNSCFFGVDSGGVNRGFYDLTQNRWIIYCDGSKSNLNSVTVPSGQTLTIAGTLIV